MPSIQSQPPVLNSGGRGTSIGSGLPADQQSQDEYLQRARVAYEASTQWFDASVRPQLRKNIANFRSIHPEGSKYLTPAWRARSRVFRPKSRAHVRRQMAALAVALFATSDLVTVRSYDQANKQKNLAATIKQKLLQYRLEHRDMTWFVTCLGAAQDANVTGVVISHQYWRYKTVKTPNWAVYHTQHSDGSSEYELEHEMNETVVENRPAVDLIPVENFRFDPACDWRNPCKTSPFLIYECPTYVGDVKQMIETGEADAVPPGSKFDDTMWWAVASQDYDSLRAARDGARVDKYADKTSSPDAQVVWIRKHVHRIDGRDWYWETVGDVMLFKTPRLLLDAYPHLAEGERPFVMGFVEVESHKVYPTSTVQLGETLQEEINDVANLGLDQVKMSTFGRWLTKRNAAVDVATLKAGVPQSVIAVDDVNGDVRELRQQEPPRSNFMELDRLQTDLDDVLGNFSPASAQANKQLNETIGGLNLLSSDASQIKEMEIRTLTETWVEPVLQQVYDMECTYESDEDVLNDVAAQSNVTPDEVLGALKSRSKVKLNVGFNATSPEKRIGRLMLALKTLFGLFPDELQSADRTEIRKEILGAVGYDDGERFFPSAQNEDPQVAALKQRIAQLEQMVTGKMIEQQTKVKVAEIGAVSRERVASITGQVQWDIANLAHNINWNRTRLDAVDRQLQAQAADVSQQELELERTALQHSIDEDERQFALLMHKAINGEPAPRMPPGGDGPPAMRAPMHDAAGTLARGDYGDIPFQAG